MYTRCPSCRAQISFELPQSADSFPEGYKHKIKCPSCGVTIGVKIPRVEAAATVQPTYTPANPAASEFEPTYQAAPPVPETKAEAKAAKKGNKKSGIVRNIFVMLFSLLFIAINVLTYLAAKGTLTLPDWAAGLLSCDGIGKFELLIKDFESFKGLFEASIIGGIFVVLQMLLFVVAGLNFLVAFIAACGKKYARAWNFISALILLACSVIIFFAPIIAGAKITEYFKAIIDAKTYALFALPAIGILQFIFALCFCASLERKAK